MFFIKIYKNCTKIVFGKKVQKKVQKSAKKWQKNAPIDYACFHDGILTSIFCPFLVYFYPVFLSKSRFRRFYNLSMISSSRGDFDQLFTFFVIFGSKHPPDFDHQMLEQQIDRYRHHDRRYFCPSLIIISLFITT